MMFGLPITVYKGYRRTFMWVGDWVRTAASAAQLFDHASAQWVDCRGVNRVPTFNLGGEEMLEVQELRDRIAALLGYGSPYAVLDAEKANVVSKRPDNELAKILLGHSPTTTLAYGLPRTLDWMREVYDTRGRLRDPAWAKIGLERIWRTNSSN
jgi:dTDP-glucose 4,6-dehydratase